MQTETVFDAVRRGYNELEIASNQEIIAYFDNVSPNEMVGHISNIKGITFEQEVASLLAEQGVSAELFEATNHPMVDIALWSDSDIAFEAQLKATDSVGYINATLEEYPDIPIIATSEVAIAIDSEMVIDSGINHQELTELVEATLSGASLSAVTDAGDIAGEVTTDFASETASEGVLEAIADVALPISPLGILGLFFGLPF